MPTTSSSPPPLCGRNHAAATPSPQHATHAHGSQPNRPALCPRELVHIVRQDGQRLYRYILRQVGNPSDAEDLLQSTYLTALKSLSHYQGLSTPQTWLFGIARNLILGFKTRSAQSRYVFHSIDEMDCELPSDYCSQEHKLEQQQQYQAILDILDHCPPDIRDTAHSIFFEGLSYAETAERLAVPIGTIRSRLARLRQKLMALQASH